MIGKTATFFSVMGELWNSCKDYNNNLTSRAYIKGVVSHLQQATLFSFLKIPSRQLLSLCFIVEWKALHIFIFFLRLVKTSGPGFTMNEISFKCANCIFNAHPTMPYLCEKCEPKNNSFIQTQSDIPHGSMIIYKRRVASWTRPLVKLKS